MKRSGKDILTRTAAGMLLLTFIQTSIPAQEISRQTRAGQIQLEYYLERASREISAESRRIIAEQGMVAAMTAWENRSLQESDRTEEEKERALEEFRRRADAGLAAMLVQRQLEDRNAEKKSRLREALRAKAAEWKYKDESGQERREVDAGEAARAREQWSAAAAETIKQIQDEWNSEYENIYTDVRSRLKGLTLSDDETKRLLDSCIENHKSVTEEEYRRTARQEENLLLRNALYDQSYELNEFSPFYHQGWDGTGSGNIVASLKGELYLDYLNAEGFQVNNTTSLGIFNTSHASANTIDQYFNLFGQEGINMTYRNGTYLLNGIQAGEVIGYMGNTGANDPVKNSV